MFDLPLRDLNLTAGGLRFKSRTGQIESDLPTACHRCNILKEAVFPGRNDAEMAPQTRYTLRRSTESIMNGLILIDTTNDEN